MRPEYVAKEALLTNDDSRAVVRRIFTYLRPHRSQMLVVVAGVLTTAALGVVPPLLIQRIVDAVVSGASVGQLSRLGALALLVATMANLVSLLSRVAAGGFGAGIMTDLQVRVFDKVQRLPIAFFKEAPTGMVVSRIYLDVSAAHSFVSTAVVSVSMHTAGLVFTLVAMLTLSRQLTLVAALLVPLFLLPARLASRRVKPLARRQLELHAQISSVAAERLSIGGAFLVKLFGRYDLERSRVAELSETLRGTVRRSVFLIMLNSSLLSLLTSVGVVAMYVGGAHLARSGAISVGTVVAVAALLQRLYAPVGELASMRVSLMTGVVAFERVFEVLDMRSAVEEHPNALHPATVVGVLEFVNVDFSYPRRGASEAGKLSFIPAQTLRGGAEGRVLTDVSFVARPDEITALVGATGSGKSTVAALAARLYDPEGGRVMLDGHDVRELSLESLSRHVGLVTQDSHMFHDTIEANLRYADPNATDVQLRKACARAQILDFIQALPDGMSTVVGERGFMVSGGERQRLAIARVLLKDPRVLVLDEATSHLDSITEERLLAALREVFKDRTVLVIAHRLATTRAAHKVLVFDAGRVIEEGSHDDLWRENGTYRSLCERQVLI